LRAGVVHARLRQVRDSMRADSHVIVEDSHMLFAWRTGMSLTQRPQSLDRKIRLDAIVCIVPALLEQGLQKLGQHRLRRPCIKSAASKRISPQKATAWGFD